MASLTRGWHTSELLLWLREMSDLSRRLAITWSKLDSNQYAVDAGMLVHTVDYYQEFLPGIPQGGEISHLVHCRAFESLFSRNFDFRCVILLAVRWNGSEKREWKSILIEKG